MLRQLTYCLMLSLICLTGYSQSAADDNTVNLSPLEQTSPPSERVWINPPDGKVLAFYITEKTGTAHGGVLILPNTSYHPVAAGNIKNLRHQLAENHWHTLALHIDTQDAAIIQQQIAAGIAFLNAEGVYNIAIVAEGQNAAHALQYIAKLTPEQGEKFKQIRALIMLDAENHTPGLDENPMAALSTVKLPVLDAYSARDLRAQQYATERKRYTSRRQSIYQQTRLPAIGIYRDDQANRITKRIRGWLDNNVAGFMVDRKTR